MSAKYAVFVRSKDGTLTERISDLTAIKLLPTLNESGSWRLKSKTKTKCPFQAGSGVLVVRNDDVIFGGVVTEISDEYDASSRVYTWCVDGIGDLGILSRRICYVDPTNGTTNTYSHYTDSGKLSVVIERLISRNVGQNALSYRKDPIVKANSVIEFGPLISVSLRFQNLLQSVVSYATANGYNVRSAWDHTNSKVYFELFEGRDLSESIVFTEQLGNILGSEYVGKAPEANFVLVGGTGELTARLFDSAQNDDSISEWGRIEAFQDARSQTSLTNYVKEVLDRKSDNVTGYSCTASSNPAAPQFGKDYQLGDYVGMKIQGVYLTAQVQQVEITVSDGIETISPKFGTPSIGTFRDIFSKIDALRQDVNELLAQEIE